MQQTMNNKVYDTETAKPLGNWQRGFSSERGYLSETLYITEEGDYFLYGEGGSRSRYAQRVAPNTWGYGERIIPFNNEEANAWAENHLSEADFYAAQKEVAYNGCLTPMMIRLQCATEQKLKKLAGEQGRKASELAEEMIRQALEEQT
ncbi:MAG: hypothetical protein LLF96_12925 [Eubacteriales bacterium]|nr:hypothetical protein [Eubacteriales bacterium]